MRKKLIAAIVLLFSFLGFLFFVPGAKLGRAQAQTPCARARLGGRARARHPLPSLVPSKGDI